MHAFLLHWLCRWLCDCLKQKTISEMPVDTMEWMDLSDENTMFSPTLIERGLTPWECSNCPWWIEYPLGIIPKQELQLHASKLNENLHVFFHLSFKSKNVHISAFVFVLSICER